jgi:hypothetical protein
MMQNFTVQDLFLKLGMNLCIIIFIVSIYNLGWVMSASTIGAECEKLGSFYVGDKVFECKLK